MNATVRKINQWFRDATRADVNNLLSKIILTERQMRIFELFYLRGKDINFIADDLCVCPRVISDELTEIRCKISAIIPQ